MVINGLTVGEKVQSFLNHAEIFDQKNSLLADLHYNPWSDNTYKGMFKRGATKLFGMGKSKKEEGEREHRADDIHINIYKVSDDKYELGKKLKSD